MLLLPNVSRTIGPPQKSEFDIIIQSIEKQILVAQGEVSSTTFGDANILRSTEATTDNAFEILTSLDGSNADAYSEIELSISDGEATLSNNTINRISDGIVEVTASSRLLKKKISLVMARSGGESHDEFVSWQNGSLAKSIDDEMTTLATGKDANHNPYFLGATLNQRNPSCWISNINLTCFSPWNLTSGSHRSGVAVSPLHTIHAWHYPISIGDVLNFVTQSNTIVQRTVIAVQSVPGGFQADTQVAKLDAVLPETIAPAKILPANVLDYLPTIGTYTLPIIAFDQSRKALAKDWVRILDDSFGKRMFMFNSSSSPFTALTETIVGGDSGSPLFVLINGEAILLSHWSGPTACPALHLLIDEINAAMTTLGGGYQLSTVDLSAFTNYGE